MVIKTSYEALQKAMGVVMATVDDGLLDEALRTGVFWYDSTAKVLKLVGSNVYTTSYTMLEAEVSFEGDEEQGDCFVQFKAKELKDKLAVYSSLSMTEVTGVELHIDNVYITMYVMEEGKTEDIKEEYANTTRFRMLRLPIKPSAVTAIQHGDIGVEGVDIPKADIAYYLNALLPMFRKEALSVDNVSSRIFVGKDTIYTVPLYCIATMTNMLADKGFCDFILRQKTAQFIHRFIGFSDVVKFAKKEAGDGVVYLSFENDFSKAVVRVNDFSNAYDITGRGEVPVNGIVISKPYMFDVLRRFLQTMAPINVEVTVKDNAEGKKEGTMVIVSEEATLSVPVLMARGEGTFKFSLIPDTLGSVMMKHNAKEDEFANLYMYLETDDDGKRTRLCVKDNGGLWATQMNNLGLQAKDFQWD